MTYRDQDLPAVVAQLKKDIKQLEKENEELKAEVRGLRSAKVPLSVRVPILGPLAGLALAVAGVFFTAGLLYGWWHMFEWLGCEDRAFLGLGAFLATGATWIGAVAGSSWKAGE